MSAGPGRSLESRWRRMVATVQRNTVSAMRRYLDSAEQPAPADVDHLVKFCLRGLGTS